MRLLNTNTGQFVDKDPEKTKYAILSHTWRKKGEQTYEQLRSIQRRYAPVSQTQHNGRGGEHEGSTSPTLGSSESESVSSDSSSELRDSSPEPEVENGSPSYAEDHHLPIPLQSRSGVPQSRSSLSGQQDPHGPSPTSPISDNLPSDCPSVTTSLVPPSPRTKSCFTRGMARLKAWIQYRSARNSPHISSGSPSATTFLLVAPRRRSTSEDGRGGPYSPPPPGQLQSDSPSATKAPLAALGRLPQREVEALFHTFGEAYGLASRTPTFASTDPSAPTQERQHEPSPQSIWDDPELSPKIREACAVARKNGYRYIWIDSCCIDKSSSSELSEAINSMYKWYGRADVCYAYLADVPPGEDLQDEESTFRNSRWFCRGWTLQELIAPLDVVFLSKGWVPLGSKHDLVELVESVTKIDEGALLHLQPLDAFSVAQRLSWAANRKTTREEDRAYSLLGIFDINMPTLYGEGDRAFQRLQEQITQRIPDQSLFAWGDVYVASQVTEVSDTWNAVHEIYWNSGDDPRQLFARSPRSFQNCADIRTPQRRYHETIKYKATPYGIRTQLQMIPLTLELLICATKLDKNIQLQFSSTRWYLAILGCEHSEYPGHLLGRVCYIPRSESGVEYVHSGSIEGLTLQRGGRKYLPDLFPLSPETIERFHPHTELKMVYIPHPDRTTLHSKFQRQPYTTIKLVLQRKTRDALRSRGYSANLRAPDPAHPTTHSLTLAKDEHTVTVEFWYTLENGGEVFAIEAEVKRSPGSHAQVDSTLGSDRVDWHTVSWLDFIPWKTKPRVSRGTGRLNGAGACRLTVDLGLDFVGRGVYSLAVNVVGDVPPASSAVELAVNQRGEEEGTEEGSHSGAVDTEDAAQEDADGCRMGSVRS